MVRNVIPLPVHLYFFLFWRLPFSRCAVQACVACSDGAAPARVLALGARILDFFKPHLDSCFVARPVALPVLINRQAGRLPYHAGLPDDHRSILENEWLVGLDPLGERAGQFHNRGGRQQPAWRLIRTRWKVLPKLYMMKNRKYMSPVIGYILFLKIYNIVRVPKLATSEWNYIF